MYECLQRALAPLALERRENGFDYRTGTIQSISMVYIYVLEPKLFHTNSRQV